MQSNCAKESRLAGPMRINPQWCLTPQIVSQEREKLFKCIAMQLEIKLRKFFRKMQIILNVQKLPITLVSQYCAG